MSTKKLQNFTIHEEDESDLEELSVRKTSACCCSTRTLLVFVSIVSIGSIALSMITLLHHPHINDDVENRSGLCVGCSELSPKDGDDERAKRMVASLERHVNNGVEMCCARNDRERSEIRKLQMKRLDSLTYSRIFNGTKVDANNFDFGGISAHKILPWPKENIERQFGEPYYKVGLLIETASPLEHVNGVDVTPLGLKVKVAGLYFVYKSVYFLPNVHDPCGKLKQQTFSSVLLRNSTRRRSRNDILLRSEHTCCPNCDRNRETSFTGGIFYLDRDDLIEVEISAYGLLYFNSDTSYMGLIIMGTPVPKV